MQTPGFLVKSGGRVRLGMVTGLQNRGDHFSMSLSSLMNSLMSLNWRYTEAKRT